MFNLYQIIQGAQGGQAIDNLAAQFGLSSEQADSAVKSLVPALSSAFMAKAAQPGGYGAILGAMTDDHHKQAYADPDTAQAPETQHKGGDILTNIFGNDAIIQQVAEQASRFTGIPSATLVAMLPVIASMVIGGVATTMHNQGMGGLLGQLAGMAEQGGLGGILGQFTGAQPGAAAPGGLGGLFGGILGGILGGGAPAGAAPGGAPGAVPPAMQAGLDALTKMFQPGVQPARGQAPDGDLADEIGSIFGGKR